MVTAESPDVEGSFTWGERTGRVGEAAGVSAGESLGVL